jgi:hypothetical protein
MYILFVNYILTKLRVPVQVSTQSELRTLIVIKQLIVIEASTGKIREYTGSNRHKQ